MDQLMDTHSFDLPAGLVDNEFNAIWEQIMNAMPAGRREDRARPRTS